LALSSAKQTPVTRKNTKEDASESAATSFNGEDASLPCSTSSSFRNLPRKKCTSSSSFRSGVLKTKMFVLVFFCLIRGSLGFEGPASHYDGGGDDRIVTTKDQMNEIDSDNGSACSNRTADLVSRSRCSVSNDATATLDYIDAVAAKLAISNAPLLVDILRTVSTSGIKVAGTTSKSYICTVPHIVSVPVSPS
tara:strand:- start:405 stop:983 length:579 start_codon:yes stop_codon:yes gene_type:complete